MHLTESTHAGSGRTASKPFEAASYVDSKLASMSADDLFTETQEIHIGIPIILILGPPGCGKGTLSKRLAADYNLYHFSVGDWLRAQTPPPIVGVPEHINKYVHAGEVVPTDVLTVHYSSEDNIPPPLLLYNCGKRDVSTPSEMWLRALPAMRTEFERIAQSTGSNRPTAILLDNFPKTITHARAAAEVFGAGFPALAISIACSEEVARSRFLSRGRGSDDAGVFGRRYARSARETPAVVSFYQRTSSVVEVDAAREAEAVYGHLATRLAGSQTWMEITDEEDSDEGEVLLF
ncbi:hypothetical protein LTR36_010746 [Oleoguttula mirabilis]|uniref:Adenylate kinase n=1 Tax=Oleoguttula mirabilis TaxID=1507867 RepID=A0AAV9JS14_9PEZI|nr:hypothetical protein LTR36_010746 [Oleoguttula mirabilis]